MKSKGKEVNTEGSWVPRKTDRAALHDVPPEWAVGGLLSQLQEVVQHHLADEVVPREAVEVIDAEVQFALGQLSQWHRELECLVEHRVQRLPVDLEGWAREGYRHHSHQLRFRRTQESRPKTHSSLRSRSPDPRPLLCGTGMSGTLPLDLGLELFLAVWQQVDLDVGV